MFVKLFKKYADNVLTTGGLEVNVLGKTTNG